VFNYTSPKVSSYNGITAASRHIKIMLASITSSGISRNVLFTLHLILIQFLFAIFFYILTYYIFKDT